MSFVHTNPEKVAERITDFSDDIAVKRLQYDFDELFYAIYTTRVGGGNVKDIEINITEETEAMEEVNSTIVLRLVDIWRRIISENEKQEGVPVEAYKNPSIGDIPDALTTTSWDGTAIEIAGRLASNLILKHALPNANHRTAIAMIEFYLHRIDPNFVMPDTNIEIDPETYDWQEWVNNYIDESKRLLTIRRNNVLLKHVQGFGAAKLERKHGVTIELSAYELDMYPSEAKEFYAEKHEQLWIDFVEDAVERAGKPELTETTGPTKRRFAEKIRNLS